jgi:hypothetical protein
VLWQPIAEAVSNEFTVYLWDMLGYGTSVAPWGSEFFRP